MSFQIDFQAHDALTKFDSIIDVRSPSEFAEDHVPGAINLPVMNDAQRATIGTIYVRESAFKARKLGAAIVARNAAAHIEQSLQDKGGGWQPLVYCWRGGQRSNSFASILQQIGWRTEVLDGGYRSYRSHVVHMLHDTALPHRIVLLDGNTGSGKTATLHALQTLGVQVLDLEGLAQHRGSIFGATQRAQPSQKMFESRIAQALSGMDPNRPIVVEAESSKIGNRILPASLWKSMCAAPRIEIAATLLARAKFLARDYAADLQDAALMAERINKLRPYCSHARVDRWQIALQAGQHEFLAAELMQYHYDAAYARSRKRRDFDVLARFAADALEPHDVNRLAHEIAALLD